MTSTSNDSAPARPRARPGAGRLVGRAARRGRTPPSSPSCCAATSGGAAAGRPPPRRTCSSRSSARGYLTRENVVLRDPDGGSAAGPAPTTGPPAGCCSWSSSTGRLEDDLADRVAGVLFGVGRRGRPAGSAASAVSTCSRSTAVRSPTTTGSTGGWSAAGFAQGAHLVADVPPGRAPTRPTSTARSGRACGSGSWSGRAPGCPSEDDLRTVHDILESAFADHFNSHEETFDEFVFRLREDPGHRWDHWWIAELVDGERCPSRPVPWSARSREGGAGRPDGSYVEYIGVLQNARGRGVAKSLLKTVIADAAARWPRPGRPRGRRRLPDRAPTVSTCRWAGRRRTSPSRGTATSR